MSGSRFPFLPFVAVSVLLTAAVGALNWLVDPLWYGHGNRITGRNFSFNERISKVNLLSRTVDEAGYDCLILGSSRVTALRPSRFKGLRCFNFALKGAEAPEQLAYGRFAREKGVRPRVIFVGVDDFNFIERNITKSRASPEVTGTPSFWHAWFSVDVTTFSLMSLAGISPDPNYYDRNFEERSRAAQAPWTPQVEDKADLHCSLERVGLFREVRALFPDARAVAFAPLMSPWYLLSDVRGRGLLDCTLDAYHAVAADYDAFLDFGIPSPLTLNNALTSDGTHFTPEANDALAARLQGAGPDIALDVKRLDREAYGHEVRSMLKAFVDSQGLQGTWNN